MQDKSWKKNDTDDPSYKLKAAIALSICAVLGALGGLFLGLKISGAEEAISKAPINQASKQPPRADPPHSSRH